MARNFANFAQAAQTKQTEFQNASWYPDFLRAYNSGDPNQVIAFAQSVGPQHPDFANDPAAQDFIGKTVVGMQDVQHHGTYDTIGDVGGTLGKIGLAASALYAGGVGAGLFGEGAGVATAGDAAIAGGTGTDALASGTAAGTTGTAGVTGAAPMGDWWTDLGMTAADVGEGSAAPAGDWWTQYGLSASDVGANAATGGAATTSGVDIAALAKQYGPALARLAPGLLGAAASGKQAGALQGLAGQYANYGAPSRARFEASMTPGFDPSSIPGYTGAVDTASKSLLARLSATGGNPFGNPGGLIDANKQIVAGTALPAVQEYQRLNAGTGFGTTLNAAGTLGGQAIGAQGNVYNAIGAGINDAVNPPQTLAQQLAELRKAGLYSPNGLS